MVRLRFRATLAANLGHVFTIPTDDLTALVPGFAGFLRGELVGGAFFVGRLAAPAGDLAPRVFVHAGKAALNRASRIRSHNRFLLVHSGQLACQTSKDASAAVSAGC